MARTHRLEMRLNEEENREIERLAKAAGMSKTRFLIWKALKEESYLKMRGMV